MLAGADPECLAAAWTASVDERSLGRMGTPHDEIRQMLAGCGAAVADGRLDQLVALEAENWRHGALLYEDVLPALERMRGRGHRLAVVSNCSWQTRDVLEATGLDRAVDVAILSFEVEAMKPDPAILRLALARLGAGDAVLVDDVAEHLDAARAIGLRTVLMDRAGAAASPSHPAAASLRAVEQLLAGSPP